jgi:dolichyl-phosphate beta-glucosyltransferase
VSIVLPSYRGAAYARRHVPLLLHHLHELGVRHEVIIVDDGSADGGETRAVAAELGCTYLENAENRGKGASVRRGMLAARGRFRLFTDIDLPYEFEDIDRFLYYLNDKEYHFVAGDRTLAQSRYFHEVPAARVLASHVYSTVVGRLVASGWFDTQCGLKGFRAEVAEDLFGVARVDRFAFDVELFYIALKRNYDIKRLPVHLRVNEASTVSVVRDGAAMVRDIGVIRWNQFLGRYAPQNDVEPAIDTTPRPYTWRKVEGKGRR